MSKLKTLSIISTLTLSVGLLGACGADEEVKTDEKVETNTQEESAAVTAPEPQIVYQGLGTSQNFRVGPGKDSQDVQVYSFNYVTADALFDEEGKIINIYVDALEVSTPNYDGETMPHFSGWPGKEGYNITDHATAQVSGVSENTEESITEEVANWQTKRDRGDSYGMNYSNDWHKQMDAYQEFFKGKTVAEIEEWFAKYTSDVNGKPLSEKSDKDGDQAKFAKLTADEKAELADVVSGATFSLRDGHGDILGAIKEAYENRVEVNLNGEKAATAGKSGSSEVAVGELKDGSYKAEYKDFDSHGYKPTLEVKIAGGKITEVTYDEVMEDGSKKSEDEEYGSQMDVQPADAYAQLAEGTVSKQNLPDTVSGASASSETFKALLTHVLEEMAPNGTTSGTIE